MSSDKERICVDKDYGTDRYNQSLSRRYDLITKIKPEYVRCSKRYGEELKYIKN